MLGAIDRELFDVIPIGITRDGAFVLEEDAPEKFALDAEKLPEVVDNGTRVRWPEHAASRELTVVESDGRVRSLGTVDVVFPILHGPFGEDGTIQGMLDLIGMPYVGSGVLASALGMDKHFTKTVLQHAGLRVAPWQTITLAEYRADARCGERALDALGAPVFVKPARAGSSVGVSRAEDAASMAAALEIAFAEDDKVLIESSVSGRELEIAVLEGRDGAEPRVSVAGEIVVSGRDFYDFDAKYLGAAGVDLICPAELTEAEYAEFAEIAARAFTAIGGRGLARVDVFRDVDGFVINEINTMPGFTPISMFPRCWIASGLSYSELITELIELGRATRRP